MTLLGPDARARRRLFVRGKADIAQDRANDASRPVLAQTGHLAERQSLTRAGSGHRELHRKVLSTRAARSPQ